MGKLRPRLAYANVMATIAVFIALGGASYAAFRLPKNSVGTRQLRKNAVNGAKVLDNSLTGNDIEEASLGTVPRAADADRAAQANQANQAQNAQSLGGLPAAQFYSKAESDSRFLHGSGQIIPMPLVTLPISIFEGGLIGEVPGAGKLEETECTITNAAIRYTNESSVTQNFVLMDAVSGINSPPEAGTLAPGKNFEDAHNGAQDVMTLMISGGANVLEFKVAISREGTNCLWWGTIYSG
jgi:hypothetical protein